VINIVKYEIVNYNGEVCLICDFPNCLSWVISIKDEFGIKYINKNKYKK